MKVSYEEAKVETVIFGIEDDIVTASKPKTDKLELDKVELDSIDIDDSDD